MNNSKNNYKNKYLKYKKKYLLIKSNKLLGGGDPEIKDIPDEADLKEINNIDPTVFYINKEIHDSLLVTSNTYKKDDHTWFLLDKFKFMEITDNLNTPITG